MNGSGSEPEPDETPGVYSSSRSGSMLNFLSTSLLCLGPDSTDRPLVLFSLPDVHNTTTLLLSDDGSTLYVGAQDALLSLDVSQSDVISLKKKVSEGRFIYSRMIYF